MSLRAITKVEDYLENWTAPVPVSSTLHRLRSAACEQLLDGASIPNRKTENWRYANLNALLSAPLNVAQKLDTFTPTAGETDGFLWEIRDGFCHPITRGDYPPGVQVDGPAALVDGDAADGSQVDFKTLLATRSSGHPFDLLNLAALTDALVISVAPGTHCSQPLRIRYSSSGNHLVQHPLVVLRLGQGASCSLIEEDATTLCGYMNARLSVQQDADSSLHHQKLQCHGQGWQTCSTDIRLAAGANYELVQMSMGSELRRNDLAVTLAGFGANARLNGACFSTEKQQLDNHLTLVHELPGGQSNVNFRGLAAGHSTIVFNGRILIKPGASQSDAKLTSANLLLSKTATINTKPELEIYASDVQCAHGATVGQLDPAAIFYCLSRGLSVQQARRLLAIGFVGEVLDAVQSETNRLLWLEHLTAGVDYDEADA